MIKLGKFSLLAAVFCALMACEKTEEAAESAANAMEKGVDSA